MATVNLGSIKFKWKGTYAGGTAYTIDDVVSYNGSSYICIQASTGNLPTDTTYFEQMSAKGTDGTNGTDGTDLGTLLTTQGDIVYRDGSGLARLGAGVAGQALITNGTGANPSWGDAGGGKILQVVEGIDDTEFETTSTTFVATPLDVNITPSSTSSKILVMASFNIDNKTSANYIYTTLYRDSTNLAVGTEGMQIHHLDSATRLYSGHPLLKLDSPNTTSQITYSVRVRANSSTARFGQNNLRSSIVAMEVGA